jgi:hypothetical protein
MSRLVNPSLQNVYGIKSNLPEGGLAAFGIDGDLVAPNTATKIAHCLIEGPSKSSLVFRVQQNDPQSNGKREAGEKIVLVAIKTRAEWLGDIRIHTLV